MTTKGIEKKLSAWKFYTSARVWLVIRVTKLLVVHKKFSSGLVQKMTVLHQQNTIILVSS